MNSCDLIYKLIPFAFCFCTETSVTKAVCYLSKGVYLELIYIAE